LRPICGQIFPEHLDLMRYRSRKEERCEYHDVSRA